MYNCAEKYTGIVVVCNFFFLSPKGPEQVADFHYP